MFGRAVKDVLVGALIGIVSMLPGASGATIAVIFGVYERLIADVANIRTKLLKDLRFIIPLGLGIVLGLFACAFGLEFLIDNWEVPTMFFFAALILTQIPDIRKLSDDGVPMTSWNWLALAVGIVIMLVFLFIGEGEESAQDTSNMLLMFLVGVILAISKLAPGISGSTILLALGLYTPFMEALTHFDVGLLVPIGLGLVIGALAFAKVIDHFMQHNRKSTYMVILGLTIGSVVTVTIQSVMMTETMNEVVGGIIGIALGIVLGICLSKVSYMYAKETIEGPSE